MVTDQSIDVSKEQAPKSKRKFGAILTNLDRARKMVGIPITLIAPSTAGLWYGKSLAGVIGKTAVGIGASLVIGCCIDLSSISLCRKQVYDNPPIEETSRKVDENHGVFFSRALFAGPTFLAEREQITKINQDESSYFIRKGKVISFTNGQYNVDFDYTTPFCTRMPFGESFVSVSDIEARLKEHIAEQEKIVKGLEGELNNAKASPPKQFKELRQLAKRYDDETRKLGLIKTAGEKSLETQRKSYEALHALLQQTADKMNEEYKQLMQK